MEKTKTQISKIMNKYYTGVGIYVLNDNLKFNNVELVKYLNISR